MKRNISNIICGVVAVCGLASCADTDMINIFKDKTKNLKDYEYLNDYDALKTFSNPKASPNFKLGVALEADEYNANGLVTRLANANFMELTAGNAMKMASCVDENGNLNFENVQAFVDNAEANGVSVYGHTLAWHAQQPLKWLEKLLKDKELDIDPNAKLEKEDYSGDFVGMSKFPYFVMGYEPSIVNGCLHSENPGSWYQYFIADGISIPADGNYTAIVKVKGSVANDGLTLNCGWGWGSGESASGKLKITTDWTEQKVDFTGIPGGKKCNLVLQPGSYDGTLDIQTVRLVHYESPAIEVAVNDYDYSFKDVSKFPYYVMGYEPTIVNGCLHSENPGSWYQYFIADNIPHPIEGTYVATVRVKASKAGSMALNMGWGWGSGESASGTLKVDTEWKDVKVTYDNIPAKSCNLVLQPGSFDGVIDIASVKVDHIVKMNTLPLTEKEKKDTLTYALDKWIGGIMTACDGKVKAWDVVNEALSSGHADAEGVYALQHLKDQEDPEKAATESFFWQDYLGDIDYVRTAVKLARKYGPQDMKLFINDYNLEAAWDQNNKAKSLVAWIKRWEADGETKIDGIGSQMHVTCSMNADKQNANEEAVVNMLNILAGSKKLVKISELDMGCEDEAGNVIKTENMTEEQHKAMSAYYKFIIEKYFEIIPADQQYGICQWCITDAPTNSGWRKGEPVGLWDLDYNRKHTYGGFADGLNGK
jgi:GH35 family endo-1,4-beta-xylanase